MHMDFSTHIYMPSHKELSVEDPRIYIMKPGNLFTHERKFGVLATPLITHSSSESHASSFNGR
jgi:hypothetical protein